MGALGSGLVGLGNVPTAGEPGTGPSTGGGAFPGFGPAPPAIGNSTAGAAATASRSDHTHPWQLLANNAALAALDASGMSSGQKAWVTTYRDGFTLTPANGMVAAADYRIAALNKAGFLWVRDNFSPGWWNQTTFFITSSALANNENNGASSGAPISPQEYRRRHYLRNLPGTETGSVTLNVVADLGDNDYIQAEWGVGLRGGSQNLTIQGAQTVVATGTITAATAVNRATNTPAAITAGFAWAAHVGRLVRLQGTTTTTAWCVKDNGANSGRMSEQSVSGALGAGFTVGQTVEVVTLTKVPGIHVIGANQVLLNDCTIDPAAVTSLRMDPIFGNLAANRVQFHGVAGQTNNVACSSQTFTACAFVDRAWQLTGVTALVLSCQVNQSAGVALQLYGGRVAENTLQSHFMQASTLNLAERTYAHLSGGGSANLAMFDLAAAQGGIVLANGSHYDAGAMWGAGNNATSIPINANAGGTVLSSIQAASYTVTGGVGVSTPVGSIPFAQMQVSAGPGQQPVVMAMFSFSSGQVGTPTAGFCDQSGSAGGGLAAQAQRWPISSRTIVRLRLATPLGTPSTAVTATLFKSAGGTGAATATAMTVTLPSGQAAGTNVVDSSHPILFADNDGFDVQITQPATPEGGAQYVCLLEALA